MSALLLYVGMDLPKGQLSGQSAQLQGADMEILFCLAQGLDRLAHLPAQLATNQQPEVPPWAPMAPRQMSRKSRDAGRQGR